MFYIVVPSTWPFFSATWFDHVRDVVGLPLLRPIEETASRHRALGITPAHYSCFGDFLSVGLKDLLGERATPSFLSAWSNTYWAIVGTISRSELGEAPKVTTGIGAIRELLLAV
ncbi:globin domain-containing protein [Novosphingobium tardum]|uniref:Globin domain-containing protein n=1 Tax=Novosphingobium tardum TaxID=1538021 RepID=A0ABV8RR96_9SPHN